MHIDDSAQIHEEIMELKNQLGDMMERHLQQQEQRQLAEEDLEAKQQQIDLLMSAMAEQERESLVKELADTHNSQRQKRLILRLLGFSARTERVVREFRARKDEDVKHSSIALSVFASWQRVCLLRKFVKVEQRRRCVETLKSHLHAWRVNSKFSQQLAVFKLNSRVALERSTMISLKQFVRFTERKRAKEELAYSHAEKVVKIKVVKELRRAVQVMKVSPLVERAQTEKSLKLLAGQMKKRFFRMWSTLTRETFRPRRVAVEEMVALRNKRAIGIALKVLAKARERGSEMLRRARNFAAFQDKRQKQLMFRSWKQSSASNAKKRFMFEAFLARLRLKRYLQVWQTALKDSVKQRKTLLSTSSHARTSQQRKFFSTWQGKVRKEKLVGELAKALEAKQVRRIEAKYFENWVSEFIPLLKCRRFEVEKTAGNQRRIFEALKKNAVWRQKKSIHQLAVRVFVEKAAEMKMKSVLTEMKKRYNLKRRARDAVLDMEANRKFRVYRAFVAVVAREQLRSMRLRVFELTKREGAAEAAARNAEEAKRAIEIEKITAEEEVRRLKEDTF